MRRLVGLFGVFILLTGCSRQLNGVEVGTIPEREISFNLDISSTVTEAVSPTCEFSGDFGISDYTYAEFMILQGDIASELIVDLPNHTVTRDGHTHDYLKNKSYINGLEVEEAVDILDWPVMDFTSISDVWLQLTKDYPLEAGCVGEVSGDYEYYTIQRQAIDGSVVGAPHDRLGNEEYTYIIQDGVVISLGIDVSYIVSGVEFHKQKSIQLLTLQN